MKYGGS